MHFRFTRGSAAIEWLAAAPIVLLLGLGVLQWALVFFGRSSVEYALTQAAREGAQGNALVASIESGLARGMIPYWGLGARGQPLDLAIPAALIRLSGEKATGALVWRQISPTAESFTDWAVPARDAMGEEITSMVEIPNDALQFRKQTVGTSSGQTLKDANLLKLEMRYGIVLKVPLIAPLAIRIMEQINGCPNASAGGITLGTLRLPAASTAEKASGTAWACAFYRAKDANSKDQLRWPVQTIAMVRMQTPARKTGVTASRKEDPLLIATLAPSTGSPGEPLNSPGGEPAHGQSNPGSQSGAHNGAGGSASTGNNEPTTGGSTSPSPGPASGTQPGSPSGSQTNTSTGTQTGSQIGTQTGTTASGQPGGQTSGQSTPEQSLLSRVEQEGQTKALEACRKPGATPAPSG